VVVVVGKLGQSSVEEEERRRFKFLQRIVKLLQRQFCPKTHPASQQLHQVDEPLGGTLSEMIIILISGVIGSKIILGHLSRSWAECSCPARTMLVRRNL
jgi:hypothetical protein